MTIYHLSHLFQKRRSIPNDHIKKFLFLPLWQTFPLALLELEQALPPPQPLGLEQLPERLEQLVLPLLLVLELALQRVLVQQHEQEQERG